MSYGEGEGYYELYVSVLDLDSEKARSLRGRPDLDAERDRLREKEEEEVRSEEQELESANKVVKNVPGRWNPGSSIEDRSKAEATIKKIEERRAERKKSEEILERDRRENDLYSAFSNPIIELGTDPKKAEQVYEYARKFYSPEEQTPARRAYNLFIATRAFADGLLYNTELKKEEREMIEKRRERNMREEELKKLRESIQGQQE